MSNLLFFILAAANLVATAADALTDKAVDRKLGVSWRAWHIWKWVRLYVPQAIIFFLLYYFGVLQVHIDHVIFLGCYVVAAWLLWKAAYLSSYLEGFEEIALADEEYDEAEFKNISDRG